jgi:23S rRNA G2445 N2-methylase RlmL
LGRWDATRLPFGRESVDRIVCNPPFGKQLASPEEIGPLYRAMVRECDRVLKNGGRAVFLVADMLTFREAARPTKWEAQRQLNVEVLGQDAAISVWRKGDVSGRVDG